MSSTTPKPLPEHPNYTTTITPLLVSTAGDALSDGACAGDGRAGLGSVIEHRVAPRIRQDPSSLSPCAATFTLFVLLWAVFRSCESPLIYPPVSRCTIAGTLLLVVLLAANWGVLYQTATPLPGLGVQLSTTKGLWGYPLSTSRRFVPLAEIATVVVHEGLRRWSVRYYLAVVRRKGPAVVAFRDVNPHPEVLREVYHSVREVLFDEYADDEEEGRD